MEVGRNVFGNGTSEITTALEIRCIFVHCLQIALVIPLCNKLNIFFKAVQDIKLTKMSGILYKTSRDLRRTKCYPLAYFFWENSGVDILITSSYSS